MGLWMGLFATLSIGIQHNVIIMLSVMVPLINSELLYFYQKRKFLPGLKVHVMMSVGLIPFTNIQ